MTQRRLRTTCLVLAVGWLVGGSMVRLPTGFRPWRSELDLSRWSAARTLGDGWQVRRNPGWPEVAETRLVTTGSLALEAPSPWGTLLHVKAVVPRPSQRIVARLNGTPVATLAPTTPGQSERWSLLFPAGLVHVGTNHLTLENTDPHQSIIVEKIAVGALRRVYPEWRLFIVPGTSLPQGWRRCSLPFVIMGLVLWGIFSALLIGFCAMGRMPPSAAWWGLLPAAFFALLCVGLGLVGVTTPYVLLIPDGILLGYTLIGMAVGLGFMGFWCLPEPHVVITTVVAPARAVSDRPLAWLGPSLSRGIRAAIGAFSEAATRVSVAARAPRVARGAVALGLIAIMATAFGLRAQEYLKAPAAILQWFGHQNDPQLFFVSTLAITHADWRTLLRPSLDFPLVGGGWGFFCPVGLALVLGGIFFKLWGLYPGLSYWVWSLVVGGTLLCLVPYVWQRLWGYPGIGGLIAGMLLATSQGIREMIPQMLTDAQAYVCLGGALVAFALLATRERWRDVLLVSVAWFLLGITRFLLLPIGLIMIGILGIIWWATATTLAHRATRLAKLAAVLGLTVAGLALVEWTTLSGYRGPTGGRSFFLSQIPAVGSDTLLSKGQLKNILTLLPLFIRDLGHDHPVWVLLWPLAAALGPWCVRRSRTTTHWRPFLLLTAPILFYTFESISRWIYETRYTHPTIILEAVLLAWMIDLVWQQLHEVFRRAFHPGWRDVASGAVRLLVVATVVGIAVPAGQRIMANGVSLRDAARQRAAYLAWLRPQLPETAVILTGETVDPWEVARALNHPTVFPINISSSYREQALLIDPHRLAWHPFTVINYTRDSTFMAIPHASVTLHALYSEEAVRQRRGQFATLLFDDYLARGSTLCVLGPPVDEFLASRLRDECEEGRYRYFGPGRYRLQVRQDATVPTGTSWAWYQLICAS